MVRLKAGPGQPRAQKVKKFQFQHGTIKSRSTTSKKQFISSELVVAKVAFLLQEIVDLPKRILARGSTSNPKSFISNKSKNEIFTNEGNIYLNASYFRDIDNLI